MHARGEDAQEFRAHVLTNDSAQPDKLLTVLSYWGK